MSVSFALMLCTTNSKPIGHNIYASKVLKSTSLKINMSCHTLFNLLNIEHKQYRFIIFSPVQKTSQDNVRMNVYY